VADQQEVLKSLTSCKVVFYFREMLFKLYLLYPTNYMVQTMMNWVLKKKKKILLYFTIKFGLKNSLSNILIKKGISIKKKKESEKIKITCFKDK
jgi:hypothetical protein